MTLTRDWRRGIAITLAVLAALSVLVVGNQRHVQAQTLADEILCEVEDQLNDEGLPFDFEQDECDEQGGEDPGEEPLPEEDPQCQDGIDNDHDGKTDWDPEVVGDGDPGCSSPTDDDESDDPSNGGGGEEPAACADSADNDGDGKVDMDDPGCSSPTDDDETDSNGGGGNTDNACEDGLDNDSDGKVDMDDPGCTDTNDDDEVDSSGGGDTGGNGDSSSGGGGGGSKKRSNGEVLGAEACSEYLTAHLRTGYNNDTEQVRRLQFVLKEMEGFDIEVNGVYDAATLAAVNAFQTRYASEILEPWGISAPTGYTYLTTRKKVNEVYCKGTVAFPLTENEQQIITNTKVQAAAAVFALPTGTDTPAPAAQTTTIEPRADRGSVDTATSTPRRGWWGSVGDFFRGIFRR